MGGDEINSDESNKDNESFRLTYKNRGIKFNESKQAQLNDLFVKFVVQDLQAFNIADSLLQFIKALEFRFVVPNRQTLKELVKVAYTNKKVIVKELIKETESKKSFTTDGWSSNRLDPDLDWTCHFFNKKFVLKSILLDFRDFPHPRF